MKCINFEFLCLQGTNRLFTKVLTKFGLEFDLVDCTNLEMFEKAIKPGRTKVWSFKNSIPLFDKILLLHNGKGYKYFVKALWLETRILDKTFLKYSFFVIFKAIQYRFWAVITTKYAFFHRWYGLRLQQIQPWNALTSKLFQQLLINKR